MSTTAEELKLPFESDRIVVLLDQRAHEEIRELHATGAMERNQNCDRNKKQMRIDREIAGGLKDASTKYRKKRYAPGENWR